MAAFGEAGPVQPVIYGNPTIKDPAARVSGNDGPLVR